jgi:hypothetical protein
MISLIVRAFQNVQFRRFSRRPHKAINFLLEKKKYQTLFQVRYLFVALSKLILNLQVVRTCIEEHFPQSVPGLASWKR